MKNETKVNSVSFLDYRFVLAVLVILFVSVFASHLNVSDTFAQDLPTTVTVKPSLSISIPTSTVLLSLDPSLNDFGTANSTITVATNNPNGYKLYLDASTTDLVNTTNSSYTIPTLPSNESGYTTDTFLTNYWGYKIGSGNFNPFTSGTLVSQSPGATNGIASTITFGAKIDYAKPAGLYSLGFSLKTIPQITQYYMQDLADSTLAQQVCTDTPTVVIDKRDEQAYTIRRINGSCWMISNLKYGMGLTSISLSPSNTNIDVAKDITLYNSLSSDNQTQCTTNGNSNACIVTSNGTILYNYYAATAGTIYGNSNSNEATYSLCPYGWRLPTSNEESSINNDASQFNVEYSGYFYSTSSTSDISINHQNDFGGWWSSTPAVNYQEEHRDNLEIYAGGLLHITRGNRKNGYSIRCITG